MKLYLLCLFYSIFLFFIIKQNKRNEMELSVPILRTPPDLFRNGNETLKTKVQKFRHGVEQIQKTSVIQERKLRLQMFANVVGSHAALQMQMEETIVTSLTPPIILVSREVLSVLKHY